MYKTEIEQLMSKLETERSTAKALEASLRASIADQKKEIDELNSYCTQREDEYDTKIQEYLTRLQDQTTQITKLQEELDSYEWYEEEDEELPAPAAAASGAATATTSAPTAGPNRPPSSRSNPRSRPSSAKPPVTVDHATSHSPTGGLSLASSMV